MYGIVDEECLAVARELDRIIHKSVQPERGDIRSLWVGWGNSTLYQSRNALDTRRSGTMALGGMLAASSSSIVRITSRGMVTGVVMTEGSEHRVSLSLAVAVERFLRSSQE